MMGGIKLKPSKREIETLKLKPSLWVTSNIKKEVNQSLDTVINLIDSPSK